MWFPLSYGNGKPFGDGITWNGSDFSEPKYTLSSNTRRAEFESQRPSLISPMQERSDANFKESTQDPSSLMIVHPQSDSKKKKIRSSVLADIDNQLPEPFTTKVLEEASPKFEAVAPKSRRKPVNNLYQKQNYSQSQGELNTLSRTGS